MNKKMIGTICGIITMVSCGICSIGYAIGNSNDPWWLIVCAGGILCAIISQIAAIKNEESKEKKHKKIIGCVCSSISMISVLIFLITQITTNNNNSWIIVFVGGIISAIIYMIDNAMNESKKN